MVQGFIYLTWFKMGGINGNSKIVFPPVNKDCSLVKDLQKREKECNYNAKPRFKFYFLKPKHLYTMPYNCIKKRCKTMKYNTTIGFKVIACIFAAVAVIEFVIGLQIVGAI